MEKKNLYLPGNLRYQPEALKPILGYDNLYIPWGEIELAHLEVMNEIGMIPPEAWATLNDDQRVLILNIRTTETDEVERGITQHDVNAHIRLMKEILHPSLARFVHMPLTSYDKIDTGRVMIFLRAFEIISLKIETLIRELAYMTKIFSKELQIGRTHGQHALPITVGFWFANLLYRLTYNYLQMKKFALELRGKISGAVGAYNAQVVLGFESLSQKAELHENSEESHRKIGYDLLGRKSLHSSVSFELERQTNEKTFEKRILSKVGLKPAMISSQILNPEQVTYFLFSAVMTSSSLAQLGRDGRQLMRSEVGEIAEEFMAGQVGSSTMAHKRNPINFENTEGMWIKNKNEFGKVFDTLISEHQRDLVNSSVIRDFPIILVNLMYQLETLLRPSKKDPDKIPFIKKITVNHENLQKNFEMNENFIMAEPIYISLQLAGYSDDAHGLVNNVLMPKAKELNISLAKALELEAEANKELSLAVGAIPPEIFNMLDKPKEYTGKAEAKALEVADWALAQIPAV